MKSDLFKIPRHKGEGNGSKRKSGMIVEYVIRDKDGNIKEKGIEGVNGKENGNINE